MSAITFQDIKTYSKELFPFWQETIARHAKSEDAYFSAKICYVAQDGPYKGQPVARIFPSEFDKKYGAYFELLDFNFQFLHIEGDQNPVRRLAWLAPMNEPAQSFPFINNGKGGQYVVPLSTMEVVYAYDPQAKPLDKRVISEPTSPEIIQYQHEAAEAVLKEVTPHQFSEEELPDLNPNQLTARDQYAIQHSVPCSNKPWINEMIRQGNAYKKSLT